jgi:hypothetical protein
VAPGGTWGRRSPWNAILKCNPRADSGGRKLDSIDIGFVILFCFRRFVDSFRRDYNIII